MRISDWSSDVCSSDLSSAGQRSCRCTPRIAEAARAPPPAPSRGTKLVGQAVGLGKKLDRVEAALDLRFVLHLQAVDPLQQVLPGKRAFRGDVGLAGLRGARKSVVWGKRGSVRVDLGG